MGTGRSAVIPPWRAPSSFNTATRSSSEDADWKITQTGGPDWPDVSLQKNPRISDDNRQTWRLDERMYLRRS